MDHQDAFLDNFSLERERGITIFSKQAILPLREYSITLLDTPAMWFFRRDGTHPPGTGLRHFSHQRHRRHPGAHLHAVETAGRYRIPTFLFINKMDLPGTRAETVMEELRRQFGEGCVQFVREGEAFQEELALCGEEALAAYLDTGRVPEELQRELIRRRQLFPCFFGSALKLQGVEEFMAALERLMLPRQYPEAFGAKVYKIARDPQGRPADLPEGHRRRAEGEGDPLRPQRFRGLGGEGGPDPALLWKQVQHRFRPPRPGASAPSPG